VGDSSSGEDSEKAVFVESSSGVGTVVSVGDAMGGDVLEAVGTGVSVGGAIGMAVFIGSATCLSTLVGTNSPIPFGASIVGGAWLRATATDS